MLTTGFNLDATLNAGSFGMRALFNLERPTVNTKFYAGLGFNYLFLNINAKATYQNSALPINITGEITGSGHAVEGLGVAGFEYRPKEASNLGLFAEVGYGITLLGDISGSYKLTNNISTDNINGKFLLQPNAQTGRTFYGFGVTWYF